MFVLYGIKKGFRKRREWKNIYILLMLFITLLFSFLSNQASECENMNKKVKQILSRTKDSVSMYEERTNAIQQICQELGLVKSLTSCGYKSSNYKFNQDLNTENFVHDFQTNTLMCYNYKVAASSWLKYFIALQHNKHSTDDLRRGTPIYKVASSLTPSKQQLLQVAGDPEAYRFILIRHPFDRLLSAYQNRMMDQTTDQYKNHISHIRRRREGSNKSFYQSGDYPTLEDFLLYITEGGEDEHWKPFWEACSPCIIPYTSVVKLEDGPEGTHYLLKATGMSDLQQWHDSIENRSNKSVLDYKKVSCKTLKKIYRQYQFDFILFDYSASQSLSYSKFT